MRSLGPVLFALIATATLFAQVNDLPEGFPVDAEMILEQPFGGSEGIAFNGEGRLFVTASNPAPTEEDPSYVDRAVWEVLPDGTARRVTDVHSTLGIASIGERDLLVADFGPTNAFRHDRNDDGIVWRVTPEGEKTALVDGGIGDPNFILLREDGSFLVSDDATADIYVVGEDNVPLLFSTAVNHPNGLALSDDGSTLYVAQIFKSIRPVVRDDSLWAIPISEGKAAGAAKLVARTGPYAANDGLAMDVEGRVYIAANGPAGEIWRYDPETEQLVLIARDVYGAASLAFGEGEFDRRSIYVSTTRSRGRGGRIWRIPVGVEGQPVTR